MASEPATDIEAQAESKTTTTGTDDKAEPKQVVKDDEEEAPAHASTVCGVGSSDSGGGDRDSGSGDSGGGGGGGGGGGNGSNSSKKKSAAETKEDLARVTQSLRDDAHEEDNKCARAVAAMEEMRKRAARYREKPQEVDELAEQMEGLEVDGKMALYDKTYEQHPVAVGKAISKKERDTREQTSDPSLVYGEITFKTLALVLHKIKTNYGLPGVGHSGDAGILQKPGGVFYDIGSGTGKPVIAAAILHPFTKAIGVEILEGLHATSMEILKAWDGGLKDELGQHTTPPAEVKFIHGDALNPEVCDWSDGDVVFANSTCFDEPLMRRLASAATALKKGAIFITLTKRLPATYFKVLEHSMCPMSWGSATVYISQKTTDPYGDPSDPGAEKATE